MLTEEAEDFSAETALAKRRYNALVITGMILPFLIVPFLSFIFNHKGDSYTYLFVVSRFIIWATVGLLFIYARYGEMQKFILWGEERYAWTFYLLWIVALYILCFVSQVVSYIPYRMGLREQSEHLMRLDRRLEKKTCSALFIGS